MINKVSEVVGAGHPDKVADRISEIIAASYERAGVEVLIRGDNNVINIAIFADVYKKINEWGDELAKYIYDVSEHYCKKRNIINNICKTIISQNKDLEKRAEAGKSGDQEVVFRVKNKLHEKLKKIKASVDFMCPHWDWKLLVDDVNKNISISYSKTYDVNFSKQNKSYFFVSCYILLLETLGEHFSLNRYNITTCAFEGGTFFNDVGVTGRKIIADADGCGSPHGGGAFSGKDESKAAVAGRKFLMGKRDQGVAIYIPGQPLNKPTFIKYEK